MRKILNFDGYVSNMMEKIANIICLSFIWFFSSVPVITIGASTTALYYTVNKCVRHSEGGIWREFWKSFKTEFKQATIIWLILLLVYGLLLASAYCAYVLYYTGTGPKMMPIILLVLLAVVTLWAVYIFPFLARFHNSSKQIMINCVIIALMNFRVSLLLLLCVAAALIAAVFVPLSVIFVPVIYMVISCYLLEPVFKKYMSEEDRRQEEEFYNQQD